MKVLITGINGFIGKNLSLRLSNRKDVEVIGFGSEQSLKDLASLVRDVDFVFHLAAANRPKDASEFETVNVNLTETLCRLLFNTGRNTRLLYTSSTQAALNSPYGLSKMAAENIVFLSNFTSYVFRLPNVFGKWCKPNYNSAVATFCHNIANGLPIQINDRNAKLTLAYIDDVIDSFIEIMDDVNVKRDIFQEVKQYETTVGEVADIIQSFPKLQDSLRISNTGSGLIRALYSTYVSYLPTNSFSYSVPKYSDPRGTFVEMIKTPDSGQFSYFTAHPGVTRGGHYHDTKTEKFLVIKGSAQFRFRNMNTNETYTINTTGDEPKIVETIPGWAHDVTNVGDNEMIVALWANEVFDRNRPDTFMTQVVQ